MKFNKIISVFAAVAMISASLVTVNAAEAVSVERYTDTDFDLNLLSSLPTRDDVKLRTPTVTLTVDEDPFASKIKLMQATNSDFAKNFDNGDADFYKVTATFSNLGILANGYDLEFSRAYVGIGDFIVTIDDEAVMYSGAKEAQLTGGKMAAGIKQGTTKTTANFHADATNPYPTYDADAFGDAVVVDTNAPVSVNFVVGIAKGSSVTIPASALAASVGYATTGSKLDYVDLAIEDLVIGEQPLPDIVVENKKTLASGFSWDVTIRNFDVAGTYTATFTASDVEPLVADLEFLVEADNGTIAFATLLKTDKAAVELAVAKK